MLDSKAAEVLPFSGKLGTFVVLPDGTVLSIFIKGKRLNEWNDTAIPQRLYGRRSYDNGRTWGEAELIYEFPDVPGAIKMFDIDHAPFIDSSGTLHLYGFKVLDWNLPVKQRVIEMWQMHSRDGGRTWSGLEKLDYGHRYTGAVNTVTQLSSGRILMPFSFMSERRTGVFVSEVIMSDDSGYTWRNANADLVIDNGGSALESGAIEPVTVELPDGRVWMVIRTPMGRFYESYSADDGETWSVPQPTSFVSSNSPAGLLRLKDGRTMMCWCLCKGEPINQGISYARQSLVVAIREVDGTWRGYREIARLRPDDGPRQSVCYPWLAELADGNVLVGYLDVNMLDWPGVQFKTVRVDPAWVVAAEAQEEWENGTAYCSTTQSGLSIESSADGSRELNLRPCRKGELTDDANRTGDSKLADKAETAGITWNFPFAQKGELHLQLMTEPGFEDAYITLSETFLNPANRQGGTFRLKIGGDGRLFGQWANEGTYIPLPWSKPAVAEQWLHLKIEWDCKTELARILANDELVGIIPQLEQGSGNSYIRILSEGTSGGVRVRKLSYKASEC